MAEPRKLFGRPSTLLLDEASPQPLPPPLKLEPQAWRAARDSTPPGGMRIRSVASLPDELEDPDEMEEADPEAEESSEGDLDDGAWGAAFEVDDFRAARRDPDADLIRGPAQVMMRPAPVAEPDDEDMVAMPEEGDEPEQTGVGEQVALPEGFGDDLDFSLPAEEADEPEQEAAPPTPAPLAAGARASSGPRPRVLTEDPVEGLAVAWMSATAGDAADLPDIVDDHHSRTGTNREARLALLETAVFGEAQPRSAPSLAPTPARTPTPEPPAWSPETAPGPDPRRELRPGGRTSRPPLGSATAPAAPAPVPELDAIPDAVSALAEAMQRDAGPSQSIAPRARRPTGEPPRILRRGQPETPAPASPRATRPMLDPEAQRRLGQMLAEDDAPRLSRPPGAPLDTSRRTRPPQPEYTAEPPARPAAPPSPRRSMVPSAPEDPWGPAHRNADGTGRSVGVRGPPTPFSMPAPSFALEDVTPEPVAAPTLPEPFMPNIDRPAPVRSPGAGPRGARTPPRVTRVTKPAAREIHPAVLIVAVTLIGTAALIALVWPRLHREGDAATVASAIDPAPTAVDVPTIPDDRVEVVETTPPPESTPAAVEPPAAPTTKSPDHDKASAFRVTLGMIRVTTDRKALVILDGKQQGYSPGLADLPVVPGQHTIRAVVPGTGISRTMEVRVDAGTATIAAFSFAGK